MERITIPIYQGQAEECGGYPNGKTGNANPDSQSNTYVYGYGWALTFDKEEGEYGKGGTARGWAKRSGWDTASAAGGSGGYNFQYVDVEPGQKFTVVVGKGGKGLGQILTYDEDRGQYIIKDVTETTRGYGGTYITATEGTSGFVMVSCEQIETEPVIYDTNTIDNSGTDKAAPVILELYLNGIPGDKTRYEIAKVTEDNGTIYEYYINGTNTKYNMNVNSNTEIVEVTTDVKGYSWCIDENEHTEPDKIIGDDNKNNAITEFPTAISTDYLDKGLYLHARAVDNAGNWGDTVDLKLETTTITLTSHYNEVADSNGYGPNYVPLTWTNSNKNAKFFYKLFQKEVSKSEWAQVSTNYGKPVNVLNVYPGVGNNLKSWMQKYGLGLINVDEVTLSSYNNNPESYLKNTETGEYKYDVIMFGSWDYNNGQDLSQKGKEETENFIKTGRGVLFGHDTLCMESGCYHPNFSSLAGYIKSTIKRGNARVSGSVVEVVKTGFLTKYPHKIEERNLYVPQSHTVGVYANGDIWIKFKYTSGQADYGYNNYYLATWNNCAMVVTGHSNGAATEDEQQILANVLFYLGQVTEDTNAHVYSAEDLAAPELSDIQIKDNKKENKLELDIKGIDYGTAYDHYIVGMKLLTAGTYYSNTVHTIVKTGIAKFQYTINDKEKEYRGNEYEVTAINKENCKLNIDKSYIGKYLHIRAVDNAGNVGEPTHIYLDGARTISREEKDETEELYCIEEDVLIPAKYDGTQSDATIEIAGKKETLNWPLNLQKIFEIYEEDGASLRNPYAPNGREGFADKSNTLGRYLFESMPGRQNGKEGNASEIYAYILSHYSDNNTGDSESQNALYEVIAEEKGIQTDGSRRNALYYEAKEYAKFKEYLKSKGGFIPSEVTHNVQVGYNVGNKQYIIGPFELTYDRRYSLITDGSGNRRKIEFSGIGIANGLNITEENAIRIYDQNGSLIPANSWQIEYDDKAEKEKTRSESYSEYGMPLSGEEFYIKLNRTGNEQVTEISKIEVSYYEIEADAQYRILNGNYSTIEWNAKNNKNVCEGGSLCPHGREEPHTLGHTYFVSSQVTAANLHSQRLLEVDWAKRGYKQHIQTLTITSNKGTNKDNPKDPSGGTDPDKPGGGNGGSIEPVIRLTMNFRGNIWNDQNENISNGLRETDEKGIKGVEVYLKDAVSRNQIGYTVTDDKGNYEFKEVPVGTNGWYYIEYTYDGQTYQASKSFAKGNNEDYKTNGNGSQYGNVSVIDEKEEVRQELNDRYYEICRITTEEGEKKDIAIGKNQKQTELSYKEEGTTSKVITRDEETQIAYSNFNMKISSENNDIYFPATNTVIVNGIPYLIIDDSENINVGLSEREKTDQNLRLDVYQTTFSIKGVRQSYIHSEKDIRNIDSNKIVKEYIQKVNPDDYKWRLKDYENNEKYEEIKEIYGSGEDCELETYVEYMIVIRNSGSNDTAYITELADYYDKTLEYRDHYRDFDISSWIVIRNDDETEDTYTGGNNKEQIKWSENSRYGAKNDYSDKFNKMYANLENYGIKKGQYAEIHIIFRVLKDNNKNIMLDAGEGKQNAAEINGYKSENTNTGKVTGLIDKDSKPGDLNPIEEAGVYEDDEDKAPNYKLVLGYANGDNGGNGSGSGDNGNGSNGGNDGKVDTDENGNPVGYGNTIEGNVWEDLKDKDDSKEHQTNYEQREDGRYISNGIKEAKEPLINDVKVELVEILKGTSKKTGEYKEIEIALTDKTVRTGTETLLTEKVQSEGAYRFSHLTGGNYKVRFTYGEKEQLEKNIKYNGQDYQAMSTAQINDKDKLEKSYENSEIMIAIDNSNSMTGNKIEKAKKVANTLIERLSQNLPGIKIGIANFNNEGNLIGKVGTSQSQNKAGINGLRAGGETAIARGIVSAKEGYTNEKTKQMIIITDGQETVDLEEDVIRKIESLKESNIGLISILTNESDNIFGTEEKPRYGSVYSIINQNNVSDEIINQIYEKVKKDSEIEKDRSLGKDLEADRKKQIDEYSEMTYKKATVLDVEGIEKLTNTEEKQNRIEALAESTKMRAETKEVTFEAGNVGTDKIHEVNQALIERPLNKLEMKEAISGIKVKLSDGSILIDTEKGIDKNVMIPEKPDAPVSIYMDEEIMQGAEVEIIYSISIVNTGEVDMLSNYIEGASDSTIPTTAKVIYAYINKNLVYRQDSQEGNTKIEWEVKDKKSKTEDGKNLFNEELSEDTKDMAGTKITLRTDGLKETKLYPEDSKEVKEGNETANLNKVSANLTLSRLLSPEDDETTSLTYDCSMEITVRGNEVGRRIIGSIPGNQKVNAEGAVIELEPDEATSRKIIISKPLGENRNQTYIIYIVAGLGIVAIIGIVLLPKKKKK